MARKLNDILRDASELPEHDRATLVGLLMESLEPAATPEIAEAWEKEIERRAGELDRGEAELIPWEQVRDELFGRGNEG